MDNFVECERWRGTQLYHVAERSGNVSVRILRNKRTKHVPASLRGVALHPINQVNRGK
jgi:hypothetical protein